MKTLLPLILIFFLFNFHHQSIADDVEDKTDGSFVENPPKPINSSFVGDISNSVVNDSFSGEDLKKQTDSEFVGANTITDQNSDFQGSDFDRQVKEGKDEAFAGDRTFVGDDYGK